MRVCLKSIKKIIPNLVEVISSSDYIFPGVVKKKGSLFSSIHCEYFTFFFVVCLLFGFFCVCGSVLWGFFLSCEIRISII